MDENNQYGRSMTKPLLYSWIKKQDLPPSLTERNRILNQISHDDNIGHFFIVDIKFNDISPKMLLFNEIYLPIWSLGDCNWTRMQNHLVCEQDLTICPNWPNPTIWPNWPNLTICPNGWVFVDEVSGSGFEWTSCHLNFRFRTCLQKGVPWHSANYRVWIHSETCTWHDKKIESYPPIYFK